VEDNRFSTSAFCHEPFHPITLSPPRFGMANTLPVRIIVDLDGKISSLIAG
jgi:hypothetical protein